MTLKVASLLLFLLSGVAAAQDEIFSWSKAESADTYVDYPPDVQERVDNQLTTFHDDSFTLPLFRAYQAFPEEGRIRLWSLLKGINTRLHPIIWPQVQYYVDDGYEFGCREYDEDTDTDLPITTGHCHRHCLNQGRYCAPQTEEDLPAGREGHDVMKEIVRRLCMDEIYHAKDPRFIAYLEEFDAQDCFAQEHVRACSIDALESVGMKFTDIVDCLQEETYDQDVQHTILERNMRHLDKPLEGEYFIDDLPMVSIDGNLIWRDDLSVNSIFQGYCQAFPKHTTPVACEMCAGCDDVRTCLWTLTCDGVSLGLSSPDRDINDNNKPDIGVNDKLDEKSFSSIANLNETEKSGSGGTIFFAILLLLAVSGLVMGVAYTTYRRNQDVHRKTKALQDAITSDHDLSGRAKDEDEEDESESAYRKRAEQLLAEVAMGKYGICNGEKLTGSRFENAPLC